MSSRYKAEASRIRILENFNSLVSERSSRSGSTSTSSKFLNREEQLENISPYLQRKLEVLSQSKYPKLIIRDKPKFSAQALHIILTLDRLVRNRKSQSFRLLDKCEKLGKGLDCPIAFTQCPKCDHVGLSLLTSSTQSQFSPTFCSKIQKILPLNRISQKNQPDFSSFKKNQPETSEKVPRLNFNAMNKLKIRKLVAEGSRILEQVFLSRKKIIFKDLDLFTSSVIENSSVESECGLERKYTFGYVEQKQEHFYPRPKKEKCFQQSFFNDYPSPTFSQKTAFKILFTRIKKLIFRRKLRVFLSLSKDF